MKKVVTTVEITDTQIRLLQVRTNRQTNIITFSDAQSVSTSTDENLSDCLGRMVALLPVVSDEFILLVPRQFVILRQMVFHSDDYDEIQDMIGLQLMNNIPYPIEDVIYQHHLLEKNSKAQRRVLVVIIHKEVSQRYCRFLQKVGIKDGKLALSSFGIQQWAAYQERVHKMHSCPTMMINIDTRHCEICFCRNKSLFFSRSFSFGREHLASGEAIKLVDQIKLTLNMYQHEQFGPKPEKIFIFSIDDEGEVLKERLSAKVNVAVEVLNPLHGISEFNNTKSTVEKLQKLCAPAAGLGLILSNTADLVNLAPMEIHEARQKGAQRHRLVKFICLVFLVVGLSISGQLADIHKKRGILTLLKNEIASLQPQLLIARRKIQFVQSFDQKLRRSSSIPDVIDRLNHLTPKSISLRTLSLDRHGNLTIAGYAKANAGINDFQSRLIQSPKFYNVDLKFSTKRRVNNMSVMDFKIASQLGANEEVRRIFKGNERDPAVSPPLVAGEENTL